MQKLASERVLLIGDTGREMQSALAQAAPGVQLTCVATVFDGIAELCNGPYTTVLASAEPIERRPEAAVRTLRQLTGNGRVVLFGHSTLKPLTRKMLRFGCDDYLVTPASVPEVQQIFSRPPMRLAGYATDSGGAETAIAGGGGRPSGSAGGSIDGLSLADIFLDALLQHPHDSIAAALRQVNAQVGPGLQLFCTSGKTAAPVAQPGQRLLTVEAPPQNDPMSDGGCTVHLLVGVNEDQAYAEALLTQVSQRVGKAAALQDRHNRLQKLAITDELTGLYNARYFRHFLARIVERARQVHFPVTLLLFDIDDFKKYNDQFGHGVGDEILRQTAALMKRCTREHDLVARIGGDEFAVVFWDKEGPRQPREPRPGVPYRPPQTPLQIFERFKKLIATEAFPVLGQTGKGVLGVSAGLAVFPYEAADATSLIREADERLMYGAKKCGKNTIYIVGANDPGAPPAHKAE